jgi:hypothetical protein
MVCMVHLSCRNISEPAPRAALLVNIIVSTYSIMGFASAASPAVNSTVVQHRTDKAAGANADRLVLLSILNRFFLGVSRSID